MLRQQTLVIPLNCRHLILSVAPKSPLANNFSNRKTKMKVAEHFYWLGKGADKCIFCAVCDNCQQFLTKGWVRPTPLKPITIITESFSRVAIDLVSPLFPPPSVGHQYILTGIDLAIGFSEVVLLKDTNSVSVTEALLSIFFESWYPGKFCLTREPRLPCAWWLSFISC